MPTTLPSDPTASLLALKKLTKVDPLVDPKAFADLISQQEDQRKQLALQAQFPKTYITGATPENSADITKSEDPFVGLPAQKSVEDNTALQQLLDPHTAQNAIAAKTQADKLAIATGPAQAQAAGAVEVEKEKNRGALADRAAQSDATQRLLQTLSGGGGSSSAEPGSPASSIVGPGGSIKPTINANGGVSFTTTQMPALVQRAHNQLTDARNKTLEALQEAERNYPGINDAADASDAQTKAPGWLDFLGGSAGKYGGATDLAGAANDRLKYTLGVATPFSRLAQEASFGNIEQMAGQLPGVRGLATIAPLFKEHQARWGKETPLATVQRLRHMAGIMDDTLHTIETSPNVAQGE